MPFEGISIPEEGGSLQVTALLNCAAVHEALTTFLALFSWVFRNIDSTGFSVLHTCVLDDLDVHI